MQRPELITRIVDKKTVLYNIRESRLEYMFHRKHISEAQYISGSRYRRLCEISQLGSGTSNMQPRIDGYYDAMLSRVGALSELVKIAEEIGPEAVHFLKFYCWENYSILELSNLLNISKKKISYRVQESLSRLAIYFGYIKVRNTIKGIGAKNYKV